MQMVKIKFQKPEDDAKGCVALAKRFSVICLPEDTYEVPSTALAVLDQLQLPYQVVETDFCAMGLRWTRVSRRAAPLCSNKSKAL